MDGQGKDEVEMAETVYMRREAIGLSPMSEHSMDSKDKDIEKRTVNNEEIKNNNQLSDDDDEEGEHKKQKKIMKSTLRMNQLALVLFFLIVPRELLNITFQNCNNMKGECATYFKVLMPISSTQLLFSFLHPFIVHLMLGKLIW